MKSRKKKQSTSDQQWGHLLAVTSSAFDTSTMAPAAIPRPSGYTLSEPTLQPPRNSGQHPLSGPPSDHYSRAPSGLAPGSPARDSRSGPSVEQDRTQSDLGIAHILASFASVSADPAQSGVSPGPVKTHLDGGSHINTAQHHHHPPQSHHTGPPQAPNGRRRASRQTVSMKQEERPIPGSTIMDGTMSSIFGSRPGFASQQPNGYSNPTPPPSRGCHCPVEIPLILLQMLDHQSNPLIEHYVQFMPHRSRMCRDHAEKFVDKAMTFLFEKEFERMRTGLASTNSAASGAPVRDAPNGVISPPTDEEPPSKRQRVDGAGCNSPYFLCAVAGDSHIHDRRDNSSTAQAATDTHPQSSAQEFDAPTIAGAMFPPLPAPQQRLQLTSPQRSGPEVADNTVYSPRHAQHFDAPRLNRSRHSLGGPEQPEGSRPNGTLYHQDHFQQSGTPRLEMNRHQQILPQLPRSDNVDGTLIRRKHAQHNPAPPLEEGIRVQLGTRLGGMSRDERAMHPPNLSRMLSGPRLDGFGSPMAYPQQPDSTDPDRGMRDQNYPQHPHISAVDQAMYRQFHAGQPQPQHAAIHGHSGFRPPQHGARGQGPPRQRDIPLGGSSPNAAQDRMLEAPPSDTPRAEQQRDDTLGPDTPSHDTLRTPRHDATQLDTSRLAAPTLAPKPEISVNNGPQQFTPRFEGASSGPRKQNGAGTGAPGLAPPRLDDTQPGTPGHNPPGHGTPRFEAPWLEMPVVEAPKNGHSPQTVQNAPGLDALRDVQAPTFNPLLAWEHAPRLDKTYDNAYRQQVMQELEARPGTAKHKTHGDVTARLILKLLRVAESPSGDEALLLSGKDAAARVETGVTDCPIFTEGQQQFTWSGDSRPIVQMFRRMENLNRNVSVQVPTRKAHLRSFETRKLSEVQERFLANEETDEPWNILDLRNPLPATVMPGFLAGENCQLLSRVRDAVLSGGSGERTVAAKEKWNEWLDVMDWVLMSEGGHNTAPHMDSHGLATWITIQEGQFGYGWLSKPTKEERDAWIANPQDFTGGRWRFTVLTPGKTVFFNSGTVHFVFRLRRGQTLALGGHILQWTGIERWIRVLRDQMYTPHITNEDVEWSASKYVRVITDLVLNRVKNGRVEELGGQDVVDRFLVQIEEFEKDLKTVQSQPKVKATPSKKKKR